MGKIILRIFAHSCFQSSGYGESHNDLRTRSIWPLTGAMLTEDVKKLSFDSRNHKVHLVIRFSGKQIVNEMCGYYVGSKLVKVRVTSRRGKGTIINFTEFLLPARQCTQLLHTYFLI